MMVDWQVIGVDPAPKKPAAVCLNGDFQKVEPGALRKFIIERARANRATLVAWDAPLSFHSADLYDRGVDKLVRGWSKEQVEGGRFSDKAINARPFAGLPHWTVSCTALGLPFGTPPCGLRLADAVPDFSKPSLLAVEVHPAVAIGAWWLESSCPDSLPRHKGRSPECARIAKTLGLPIRCGVNDDDLDAFVAYRPGKMFVREEAVWLGDPRNGGYVMPRCQVTEELSHRLYESDTPSNHNVRRASGPRRERGK